MHILIVDDDPDSLEILSEKIGGMGHEVSLATDGMAALKEFSAAMDIVFCDILMPEMDGLELIRELRKTHPTVKIVAYSGGSRISDKENNLALAKSLGACRVIDKSELFEKVQELFTTLSS